MSNKTLREEAKELGLKYIGVSKEQLKKSIEEKRGGVTNEKNGEDSDNVGDSGKSKKLNVAVVYNEGKQEIRRYMHEIHGEKFGELANEFASSRGYTVELVEAKKNISCPNCGHVLE